MFVHSCSSLVAILDDDITASDWKEALSVFLGGGSGPEPDRHSSDDGSVCHSLRMGVMLLLLTGSLQLTASLAA